MKKLKILVLSIGIMIIAATCVLLGVVCLRTVASISSWDQLDILDIIDIKIAIIIFLGVKLPIIPQEIMLLRSVYNLCFLRAKASAKVRYIVAAVIALSVLVFECLYFTNTISYKDIFPADHDGNRVAVILLFTQWPLVLLTGILTSVNSGEEAPENDSDDAKMQ